MRTASAALLTAALLLPTLSAPKTATAFEMKDLLGSWHVLAHYKDSGTEHPERERWVDHVWKFEREGDRIKWTDYPIVVFDDETGRFERLGTNRQSRVLAYWEPNAGQIENIQAGLEVNKRGAKSKTIALRDGAWTSATKARPGSMTFISYVENWSITGLPGTPVFERSDSLSSGMTETLEGTTRYTTTAIDPSGLLLSGRFERDGTQQGTFRMMRSGGTQWVKGTGKSPNERFRDMAMSQYAATAGDEMIAELREQIQEALAEGGGFLPESAIDTAARRIVELAAAGKSEREISRILEEETLPELVADYFSFAEKGAGHDDDARYLLPFASPAPRQLSQGNNGSVSHYGKQRYAFDFEMPVGESIVAARAGKVARVVDHFTRGGPIKSLRAKANVVLVLHDDGSFASYVHLSPNALVEEGDEVEPGQALAKSGNTGFTTVPHLHFAVWTLDEKGEPRTVPIRFEGKSDEGFVPSQGLYYGGEGWKSR